VVESSVVTYQGRIIDYSIGNAGSVEFNFERIWEFKRYMGEEFQPYLLNFYHVHPEGLNIYSELDKKCMEGFWIAFGYPIYFTVITFFSSELFDLSLTYSTYEYSGRGAINQVDVVHLSEDQILFLKHLSYYFIGGT